MGLTVREMGNALARELHRREVERVVLDAALNDQAPGDVCDVLRSIKRAQLEAELADRAERIADQLACLMHAMHDDVRLTLSDGLT